MIDTLPLSPRIRNGAIACLLVALVEIVWLWLR